MGLTFNWGLTRKQSEHEQVFFCFGQIKYPTPYQGTAQNNQENKHWQTVCVFSKGPFRVVLDRVLVANTRNMIYWKDPNNSQNW